PAPHFTPTRRSSDLVAGVDDDRGAGEHREHLGDAVREVVVRMEVRGAAAAFGEAEREDPGDAESQPHGSREHGDDEQIHAPTLDRGPARVRLIRGPTVGCAPRFTVGSVAIHAPVRWWHVELCPPGAMTMRRGSPQKARSPPERTSRTSRHTRN